MQILFIFLKSLFLILFLIFIIFIIFYLERKFLRWFGKEKGSEKKEILEIFQVISDFLKLLFKKEIFPEKRDKVLYLFAPLISVIFSFTPFALIPIGKKPLIQDMNISLLFVILILSLSIYGIIFAGISSGSKYALIGSLRASFNFLTLQIPLILSIIGIIIQAESFSLREILEKQKVPYIFPQFLGFLVFFISSLAYLKRTPFDFSVAEFEIAGGYKAEYSGTKYAFFLLSEYAEILFISSLITILYLGKNNFFSFLLKTFMIIFIFFWIRASLPRIKFEHFIKFSWKYLIPLSFLNLIIVSIFKTIK